MPFDTGTHRSGLLGGGRPYRHGSRPSIIRKADIGLNRRIG